MAETSRRAPLTPDVSTYGTSGAGRDYTSVATWESVTDTNRVTAAAGAELHCYDDAASFSSTWIFSGATTNSSYFRRVIGAVGERHDGTPNNGVHFVVNTAKWCGLQESYCSIQDLIVTNNVTGSGNKFDVFVDASNTLCAGIISHSSDGATFNQSFAPDAGNSFFVDCLASRHGYRGFYNRGGTNRYYSCTAVTSGSGDIGFERDGNTMIAKNCLADDVNGGTCFSGTFSSSLTNASTDATAPGTGNRRSQTFTFEDRDNDDYHLATDDAGALTYGTDLSGDSSFSFDDDIDFETRVDPWSIGFDDVIAAADAILAAGFGTYTLSGQVVPLEQGYVVSAAQGSYALSGQAVALGQGTVVVAAQGSYALSGQDVAFLFTRVVAAAQGAYVLSGQSVALEIGHLVAAAQGTYTLSGQDVTLVFTPTGAFVIVAGQGAYALSGQGVGLAFGRRIAAGQGSYALTGQTVDLLRGVLVAADQGTYALSGQDVALTIARTMAAAQGSYALSGQAVTLVYTPIGAFIVVADQGSYTLAGQDASLTVGSLVAADQGTYGLAGQSVGLLRGSLFAAGQGTYALAGQDVALEVGHALAAAQGSYTLAGQDATLVFTPVGAFVVVAGQGSYALAGQNVGFLRSPVVAAAQGAYALAGQDVTLVFTPAGAFAITAEQGAYALAGQAAGLAFGRVLAANQGAYTLSGQAVAFLRDFPLAADQGAYTLSGQAVTFPRIYRMLASQGAYALSGQAAILISGTTATYKLGTIIGPSTTSNIEG